MSERAQPIAPRMQAYWLGERSRSPTGLPLVSLAEVPSCYEVVYLAFALVRPGNKISLEFLCTPPLTMADIQRDVSVLRTRGTKVLLAVGGWGGNAWSTVTDEHALSEEIVEIVRVLQLDGVSIDFMGDRKLNQFDIGPKSAGHGINLPAFATLIRGKLGRTKKLVLAAYELNEFVRATLQLYDWILCIDYKTTPILFNQLQSLQASSQRTSSHSKQVPLVIGLTVQDPLMSPSTVENLVRHAVDAGQAHTVFWVANEDHNEFTGHPLHSYAALVDHLLPRT